MPSPRNGLSVRGRLTTGATVGLAALLVCAGTALVWRVHSSLAASLDASARAQARTVAGAVAGLPRPRIVPAVGQSDLVQVVDARGRVVAASADLQGEPAVFGFTVPAADTPPLVRTAEITALGPGSYRVAAVRTTGSPAYRVYVGLPLTGVTQSTTQLAAALAGGLPVLLVVLAGLSWVVAGRALRPVEVMRGQAAEITLAGLRRRVDVPAGSDELARLGSTLNDLLDRLAGSLEQQSQFVADAAHELRSPVAAIRAQLETSPHPRDAAAALAASVALSRLVDDLLALARLDAQPHLRHDEVDLDDLVLAEAHLRTGPPHMSVDLGDVHAARVLGDAAMLTRVIRNLLHNATRYARTQVAVSLRQNEDGTATLQVTDDGPGIPDADRERVFDRFTRLDDARTRQDGGAGLGLAIVRDVVRAHGGQVWIEDNSPGARVVVSLPRSSGTVPARPPVTELTRTHR